MRVADLTAYIVELPLKREVRHASATRSDSTNILVRCSLTDGTEGWGEGVPRDYVTGETPEGAIAQLEATPLSSQLDLDCRDWSDVIRLCERFQPAIDRDDPRGCYGNALRCAVELSILDAFGKHLRRPVSDVTGVFEAAASIRKASTGVRYSGAITAEGARSEAISAAKMRLYGFQQCKVKVGVEGDDDPARLAKIRRRLGAAMDIRVDANEAWEPEEAVGRIQALMPFGISCVEQPLAHEDVETYAELLKRVPVQIMLDESLTSMSDAERAVELKLCDLFNIRLSKCGGFLNSLRIAAFARAHGIGYQLGCHPGETGILSAAGRHFATSVDGIRYLEGSYDRHLLKRQITTPDITFGYRGKAPALTAPGLGIEIDRAALDACKTFQKTFPVAASRPATERAAQPGPAPRIDYHTYPDGYRGAVRIWEVPAPKARIVYLHGIISHGGWYVGSCGQLAAQGYEVHFLDRRGSGLNMEARGDVPGYTTWLEDVESYITSLPPSLPNVLLGVSWGGKLAAAFARYRPDLIAGYGMLSPGIFDHQTLRQVKSAGLRLAGRLGQAQRRVTIPLQDETLFTDSPKHQAYIASDPLTLRKVTVRLALADRELTRYVLESPESIRPPALLMLGTRDRIVDNAQTIDFARRLGASRRTIIEFEAAHTLEFEPDTRPFMTYLTAWLQGVAPN